MNGLHSYLMAHDPSERPSAEKLAVLLARFAALRGVPADYVGTSPVDKAAIGSVEGLVIEHKALYAPGTFLVGLEGRKA